MKREVHETRTKRVWKTDEGRTLLTATTFVGGDFSVDAFRCDESELQELQCAISEALDGWGMAPFTIIRDGVPLIEGKSNAVPIEEGR